MSPPLDSFPPEPSNTTRSFLGPDQAVRSLSDTRSPTEVPLSTRSGDTPPTPFFPHIPRYQIVESLGHGGMGHVFLAHDTQLRRRVALKFMLREAEASAVARQRFTNEATILAQLHHPNVVEVYDSGVAGGYRFFAMTHLPGGSLSKRKRDFRGSAAAAVRVIAAVARGVHHAHERGILHRDLKASNVLFDGDKPVVTDFGCAKWEEAELSTQGAALLGTPSHMAPEVWLRGSKEHHAHSDVWSLGVMLYQLLAGVLPFPDDPRTEAGRNQLLERDPPPVGGAVEAVPGVDERLEAVMRKVLAKAPTERYQSAAEFADDLDRWLAGEAVSATTDPPTPAELLRPKPRKRWVLVAAAVVTLTLAGVAFAVSWWPKQDTPPTTPEPPPVVTKTLAEQLLKEGDSIEFIGETGLPTDSAPIPGFVGTVSPGAAGGCELGTAKLYCLQLFRESFPFPVRWEADVAIATPMGETIAGLYAGQKGHAYPDGKPVHAAFVNVFGQGKRNPKNERALLHNVAAAAGTKITAPDGTLDANPRTMFLPMVGSWQQITPPDAVPGDGASGPTHHLVIEVRAGDYAAWRDRNPCPRPRKSLTTLADLLNVDGVVVTPPALGDGYGLVVMNGAAVFRNVRLTRLSPSE